MATAYRQLFDNRQSSEYLLLCSTEEIHLYRFWTTWDQMKKQKKIILGRTIPLSQHEIKIICIPGLNINYSLVHAISKCVCVGGVIFFIFPFLLTSSFPKVPSYFFNLIIQITSQTHNPINSWWIKSSPVLRLFSFIIHHSTGVEWFVNTVTCWLSHKWCSVDQRCWKFHKQSLESCQPLTVVISEQHTQHINTSAKSINYE